MIDSPVIGKFITKTDIFTGDVVPDCTFEIKDEEGNTLLRSKTDEKGNAYIPLDLFEDGKTYTYTEIEAPEEYLIDTTSHEITIDTEDTKIVVKDERAPETGNIAVVALVIVAVVCVAGIVFVIAKNKK